MLPVQGSSGINKPISRFCCERAKARLREQTMTERETPMKLRSITPIACLLLAAVGIVWAKDERPAKKAPTPEALRSEIEALKAAKVAWRAIAWKSCLLEGLQEARAKNKPALLWVFIDRPIDDARC